MYRFVIGLGADKRTPIGELHKALIATNRFEAMDFEIVEMASHLTSGAHGPKERATARARSMAFNYKDMASLYIGVSVGSSPGVDELYVASVNCNGEDGSALYWRINAEKSLLVVTEGSVTARINSTILTQLPIWLCFLMPPKAVPKTMQL